MMKKERERPVLPARLRPATLPSYLSSICHLEQHDPGNDEKKGQPPEEAGGISKKGHSNQKRPRGSDSGPDRIGGAHGDLFLCQPEKGAAQRHAGHRYGNAEHHPPRRLRDF